MYELCHSIIDAAMETFDASRRPHGGVSSEQSSEHAKISNLLAYLLEPCAVFCHVSIITVLSFHAHGQVHDADMTNPVCRYVTNELFTEGIVYRQGFLESGYFFYSDSFGDEIGPLDHFETLEEAAIRADKLRKKRIKKMECKIEKLRAMKFGL